MPTHVYLSPHFDDIALSCGGQAAWATAAGEPGLCVTLFAAPPPTGAPLSAYAQRLHDRWGEPDPAGGNALRRLEEEAAMDVLGLDLRLLDYPDAIYRAGRYLSHDDIFGAPHPAEAALPASLAAELAGILHGRGLAPGPAAWIYAPLGLGGHVDHQLTFAAARRLAADGWRVLYYEDFPYAARPEAHATRFAALGAADPPAPIYCNIVATVETKITAIAAYTSQISSLFPSREAMPGAVRAYAAAVAADWQAAAAPGGPGGPRHAERCWHLPGAG